MLRSSRYQMPAVALLALAGITGSMPLSAQPDSQPMLQQPRPALMTRNPVNQVLPVDTAFALQTFIESESGVLLQWTIAPGYYLYRKSLALSDAQGNSIALELPAGETLTDEYFGEVEVYRDELLLSAPLTGTSSATERQVNLTLEYQGCAENLFCYPPQHKTLQLTLP